MSVAMIGLQRLSLRDCAGALRVAIALLAVATIAAAVAVAVGPGATRAFLGFGFVGIPNTVGEVLAIMANNLAILLALLVAGFVVRALGDSGAARSADHGPLAWATRILLVVCDLAVAGSAFGQALIIGVGAGAYGERMLAALLPHGPLELAAYSLAIAAYVEARRGSIAPRELLGVGAASALILLVAAPLEVYGSA